MAKKTQKVPIKRARKASKTAGKVQAAPVQAEATHPLATLRTEIDSLFDKYFGGWPDLSSRRWWPDFEPFKDIQFPTRFRPWDVSPSVDFSETDEGYEITAELPGMDEKDIEVSLVNDVLTIKGEKQEEREESDKDYHLKERRHGSFRRTFRLPHDVETSKVGANFSKGVLKVLAPKSKASRRRTRKISVKSA